MSAEATAGAASRNSQADNATAIRRGVHRAAKTPMVLQHPGPCQPARAVYLLPARTMTVFFFAKSRTETRPRTTRVSVELQRSSTSHFVPTTVAALCLPLVRNLPLPSPQRRRFFFLAAAIALPSLGQLSFSVSVRVVVGLDPFPCPILKMPA